MYYQSQFNAMLDALMHGTRGPSASVAKRFKQSRLNQAEKSLLTRNLFVAATGNYLNANSSATFTCFTPPLGFDVIVLGCSLSSDIKPTTNALSVIRGETRIRPPQPLGNNNSQDQKAFAPATYSIYFPCPFVLEAGDQIATDFGFNAPEAADASVDVAEQQIVFFCLQVKDCLDSADRLVLDEINQEIQNNDYQRKLFIPCTNITDDITGALGQEIIQLSAAGFAEAQTRPLSQSAFVIGYSMMNADTVRVALGDSALQHSFTIGQLLKAPNLFWAFSAVEPGIAYPYYSYFKLPMPHLLRQGSNLTCSAIDGLTGAPVGTQKFTLVFEMLTV